MARPKKFRKREDLEEAWEQFKIWCDSQKIPVSKISAKTEKVIRRTKYKRITYTIEGFCTWAGISRQAFYSTYGKEKRFSDIFTRMREECEFDVRRKFETGELPTGLAALWMSRYGYSAKADEKAAEEPGVVVLAEPVPPGPPPEEADPDGP